MLRAYHTSSKILRLHATLLKDGPMTDSQKLDLIIALLKQLTGNAHPRKPNRKPNRADRALKWLLTELAEGPIEANDLYKKAVEHGFRRNALFEAKALTNGKIQLKRTGFCVQGNNQTVAWHMVSK
jgi:hypothetical protein